MKEKFTLDGTIRTVTLSSSSEEIEKNVKEYGVLLNDEEMLTIIQDVGFVAKEVHYHCYELCFKPIPEMWL